MKELFFWSLLIFWFVVIFIGVPLSMTKEKSQRQQWVTVFVVNLLVWGSVGFICSVTP